jgi:hypothetical protein
MVEQKLIKLFTHDRELWEKYYRYLDLTFVKNNYTLLYKIILTINNYYIKNINKNTLVDLESQYLSNYPVLKEVERRELEAVISGVMATEVDKDSLISLLETHKSRALSSAIALTALDVSEGRKDVSELTKLTEQLGSISVLEEETDKFEVLSVDLEELATKEELSGGLKWRLIGLNKSLGPLRKGNNGHIFASRETGKTAMWVSETMFMLPQIPEGQSLTVFFNEEEADSIIWRMANSVLRMDYMQILANPKAAKHRFYDYIGGPERLKFFDREKLHKEFIEEALDKVSTGLVLIDNMDKVDGFKADRRDQELQQAYQWARELAKKHCPVLTVAQADATAFNQMWISDAQMAEGKVGKPGETDFTIGIGRTDQSQHPYERFIYISRNKLRGDKDTLPGLRHAKFTAILEPQYSTYTDGGTHAIL